jgi:hypothetical protein
MTTQHEHLPEDNHLTPDLTNIEEARKAFIANEIFNRKY